MIRRVEILPAAEDDLDAGEQFYEEQTPGSGDCFLDCLLSAPRALETSAGTHRVVHGFHRKVSRRFPFAIFYRVEGDQVRVHAVLDCRRDPAALQRRLRGW